jgi:hypothetical protein
LQYEADAVFDEIMLPALLKIAAKEKAGAVAAQQLAGVSVITPWKDHPELIPNYERAVAGAEVIIIDNASSLENAQQLRDMVGRLGGIYIRNEQNMPFSHANEQGRAHATHEIMLFINNDIVPNAPGVMVMLAASQIDDDVLYGVNLAFQQVAGSMMPYIDGWCIWATRKTWDKLGGWCHEMTTLKGNYYEDALLSLRARTMGMALAETNLPLLHLGQTTAKTEARAHDGADHNRLIFERTAMNYIREKLEGGI